MQANFREKKRHFLYETYVTDCLKNTNDVLANIYSGSVMKERYVDIVKDLSEPQKESQKEERTAEEVIEDIGNKLDRIGAS